MKTKFERLTEMIVYKIKFKTTQHNLLNSISKLLILWIFIFIPQPMKWQGGLPWLGQLFML